MAPHKGHRVVNRFGGRENGFEVGWQFIRHESKGHFLRRDIWQKVSSWPADVEQIDRNIFQEILPGEQAVTGTGQSAQWRAVQGGWQQTKTELPDNLKTTVPQQALGF